MGLDQKVNTAASAQLFGITGSGFARPLNEVGQVEITS